MSLYTENLQPASVAVEKTQKSTDMIDDEKSGETAFDEAGRTKKVLRGGLRESKWFDDGFDPVEKRRSRGLPGTHQEDLQKVSEVKIWHFYYI